MKCPEESTLTQLLFDQISDPDRSSLWQHLEKCPQCQAQLDQLSDDPELQSWRSANHDRQRYDSSKNPACQDMVQRVVRFDTSIDSLSLRQTHQSDREFDEILEQLSPSPVADDLGMIGSYRVLEKIGQGGMAVVVKAYDCDLDRIVALKILKGENREPLSHNRFLREAKSIAGIRHPHVVAIHSISTNAFKYPFLSMEWMKGGCLQTLLKSQKQIVPSQAAKWMAQVADGLSAAHEAGIIHRDIKPSNVLLSEQPLSSPENEISAKLADFGLARPFDLSSKMTQSGTLMGTPAYMSPEHISSADHVSVTADVYSLGVTLYELLSGELPYRGTIPAMLQQIERGDPEPLRNLNKSIPKDLETICFKAMHRDSNKRYATAKEFANDLRRWMRGETILARPTSHAEKFQRWCQRHPGVALLTTTVGVLLLLIAIGSTYAAFSLAIVDEKLRKEKENVEIASRAIEQAAQESKRQRLLALDSLNRLVTQVQSALAKRPGTLQLREEILETALQGLQQITTESSGSELDRTTIEAHQRKGEILDLLGRTDEAVKEFKESVSLAEKSLQKKPEDLQSKRNLANALAVLGDAYRKGYATNEAKPIFQQVYRLRKEVAEVLVDEVEAQHGLSSILQRIADSEYSTDDWLKSHQSYKQLLDFISAQQKRFPESDLLKRDLSIAHERLGTIATLQGDVPVAHKHFVESVQLIQSLLQSDSENILYKADLAYITKRLASLASISGKYADAMRLANESKGYYLELAAADPLDTEAQMKVGVAWDALYETAFVANNLPEATTALHEAMKIYDRLCNEFPTSAKYSVLAMNVAFHLADLQMRQGMREEAVRSMLGCIEYIKRSQEASDAPPASFEPAMNAAKTIVRTLELALSDNYQSSSSDASPPKEEILYVAKVFNAYEYARQGEIERALELNEAVAEVVVTDTYIQPNSRYLQARLLALCYNHAKAQSEATPSSANLERMNQLSELCCQTTEKLTKDFPNYIELITKDPDFQGMRSRPDFQHRVRLTSVVN